MWPERELGCGGGDWVRCAVRCGPPSEASGFGAISRVSTVAALQSSLLPACRSFAVVPLDWPRLLAGSSEVRGLLVPYAHLRSTTPVPERGVSAVLAPRSASSSVSLEAVLDMVQRTAGGTVDADAPLMEAGVDSLGAVELRNQLRGAAGEAIMLPSTLVFDHPTARGLARFFTVELPPAAILDDRPAAVSDGGSHLASMRVVLPGGARGIPWAWRVAATGQDAFAPSPATRWDTGGLGVRYGAFLHDVDFFDNATFGVSRSEVSTMDPQQRLLLELGYEALHEAGLRRAGLVELNLGVYVGVMSIEFQQVLPHANAYVLTGTGHCFAAGRLSYVLGLQGACEAIDVACSAALVACHNALRALQTRDSREALFSGVNMMFLPVGLDAYAAAGLTSPVGKGLVFDARAKGFVRGEGCGAGVLQAAAETLELVMGGAVRQDGRSASFTAPNGRAQQRLLTAGLANASTVAMELQLVEAAANGSPLGDPIEAGAIAAALLVAPTRQCALLVGSIN